MRFLTFIFLFLFAGSPLAFSQGETVTIYMKSRQIMTAEITGFDQTSISFRVPEATASAKILNSQIETIVWREPEAWKKATKAFDEKRYDEAIPLFLQFLAASRNVTKYPAPGNFTTRARRKLIEAYHDRQEASAVGRELTALLPQLALLPPDERLLRPAYAGWSAVAKNDFTEVLALSKKYPTDATMAYLAGIAYQEKGRPADANRAFTRATVLDAGGNFQIAREALRESILIKPTSANVHIWATVYGNGKLWEDAPASLQEILDKPLTQGTSVLGEREAIENVDDFDELEEKAKRIQ